MRRLVFRVLTGLFSVLGLVAAGVVVASPAQAYGSLTVRYAVVHTWSCLRVEGALPVHVYADGCYLPDTVDNTWFVKDRDSYAIKVELHDSRGMVAKVEFHPWGEYLWVYDTRNDGDTIYIELWSHDGPAGTWDLDGVYSAPGTSAVIDYKVFDRDFDEGLEVGFNIFDDAARTDPITGTFFGGTA
jgi:hypothetical protein